MDLGLDMQGGTLKRVPPNATPQMQISVINDIVDRLNQNLRTQYFSDGTTRRMLIGYQENGWGAGKHFGMKVSIEGVDVAKASDAQLLFKMDMRTWFFFQDGLDIGQIGVLPNGTSGSAWAKDGESVNSSFGAS